MKPAAGIVKGTGITREQLIEIQVWVALAVEAERAAAKAAAEEEEGSK